MRSSTSRGDTAMPMLGACVQGSAPRGQISVKGDKIKRGKRETCRRARAHRQAPRTTHHAHARTHTHTHTHGLNANRGGPRKSSCRRAALTLVMLGAGAFQGRGPFLGAGLGGLGGAGATPDFDGNCWVTRDGGPQVGIARASGRALGRGTSGCRSIILIRSLPSTTDQPQGTSSRAKMHIQTCTLPLASSLLVEPASSIIVNMGQAGAASPATA